MLLIILQNFDNLDGKQARKTGNSSPMGLLFDHGCDALIVNIQGITLVACSGFGNSYLCYIVLMAGTYPFFITTLEEYYTDIMYLPIINGAVEGCFVVGFFIFISAILGPESWSQEILFGINRREITLVAMIIAGILTCLSIFHRVYTKKGFKILLKVFWNTGFSTFIHLVISYIFFFSPSGVGQTHTRLLMYISGLHWCKSCVINYLQQKLYFLLQYLFQLQSSFKLEKQSILQMCHVSNSKYNQFSITSFILLFTLLLNTVIGNYTGASPVNEVLMIKIILILSILVYIHMVWVSINQFCSVLNIRTFHIKPIEVKKIS